MYAGRKDDDVSGRPAGAGQIEQTRDQDELLPELVAHLQHNRSSLREEWAARITDAHLLSAMTPHEVFTEVTSVYDNYVAVLVHLRERPTVLKRFVNGITEEP